MGLTAIEYIILYSVIALATVVIYKIFSTITRIVAFVVARADSGIMQYEQNLVFAKNRVERRTEDRRKNGERRSKQRMLNCRNVFLCEVNDRRVADRRKP